MAHKKLSARQSPTQEKLDQPPTIAEDLDESLNKLRDVNEALFDLSWMMTEWKPESIPTPRQMHPTGLVNQLSDCYEKVANDLREIWRRVNKGGAA
jgi:hypothetical protein